MSQLEIFDNLGAWQNFCEANINGRPTTVTEALVPYRARPVFDEVLGYGSLNFKRIQFATEQDQTFWLLRWS